MATGNPRLEQVKAILSGTAVKRSPGRPKRTQSVIKTVAAEPTKRGMSAEGRAKVAAAQKLRPLAIEEIFTFSVSFA
jgi:hypothetical protein